MIQAIADLEREQAMGILARAALSLEYEDPSNETTHEAELRSAVIAEARLKLGLSQDDMSLEAIQQIGDLLDSESDQLADHIDTRAALLRLAESGDLPSDLYEIETVSNIEEVYGKGLNFEIDIIKTTVRAPSFEQHYGADRRAHEPALISLFVKHFRTKFYLKDFYMLVAGQRDGFILNVHQAWRIYPSRVNLSGAKTPVQWLQKFADQYGADVTVNGKRGHFFLYEQNIEHHNITLPTDRAVYFSRFSQTDGDTGKQQAALIVSIDLQRYRKTLNDMMVDERDMLEEFVQARRATD